MTRTGTVRRTRRCSHYSCAEYHQKGATACRGRHVPMEKLDSLVLGALKECLFAPSRLELILRSLAEQQSLRSTDVALRLVSLQTAADDVRGRLERLYTTIEDGVADEDDILRDRISIIKSEQAKALAP